MQRGLSRPAGGVGRAGRRASPSRARGTLYTRTVQNYVFAKKFSAEIRFKLEYNHVFCAQIYLYNFRVFLIYFRKLLMLWGSKLDAPSAPGYLCATFPKSLWRVPALPSVQLGVNLTETHPKTVFLDSIYFADFKVFLVISRLRQGWKPDFSPLIYATKITVFFTKRSAFFDSWKIIIWCRVVRLIEIWLK